jgi:hypothetical protein
MDFYHATTRHSLAAMHTYYLDGVGFDASGLIFCWQACCIE